MDDLFTVTQAAALKGVSRQAIHLAIQTGRLKASLVQIGPVQGTLWIIAAGDLESYKPAKERLRRAGRSGF